MSEFITVSKSRGFFRSSRTKTGAALLFLLELHQQDIFFQSKSKAHIFSLALVMSVVVCLEYFF